MLPIQDAVVHAVHLAAALPPADLLPAVVVGVVLASFATALALTIPRRETD